jgi:cytochrome c oxidase assembly protein subunit 15
MATSSASSRSRQLLTVVRQPVPPAVFSRLCRVAMVLLGLIVVTGAAVRLTKSGLGCPTWPQCGDGSFVTRSQFALHGWVEFGNRLVSLGVGVVIAVVVIGSFRLTRRRTDLRWLSGGLVLGFFAQAVLGGLTVIFHLNPFLVAGHFLVSMALLFNAAVLDRHSREPAGAPASLARRELILLADVLVLASAAVLILGTVVTGAGPHSGDTGDVQRFEINIRSAAQLHADGAMLLTGLVVAMAFAVRLASVPRYARTLANALAIAVVWQVAVGFTQYFLNIPTGLVAVHVAGATTLWILALYLRLSLTRRGADERARDGLDQLVEGDSDEQHGEIRDGEVEQPHRPRVTAG